MLIYFSVSVDKNTAMHCARSSLQEPVSRLSSDIAPVDNHSFDDITRLAAQGCSAPMAAICFLEGDDFVFASTKGMQVGRVPKTGTFCELVLTAGKCVQIADASLDARFCANPLVTGELKALMYAGAPLKLPDGKIVGTLCVLDSKARKLDSEQLWTLEALAHQAVHILKLRQANSEIRNSQALLSSLIENMPSAVFIKDLEGRYLMLNQATERALRTTRAQALGHRDVEFLDANIARACIQSDELVMRTGKTVSNNEYDTETGTSYSTIKFPLFDEAGKVTGIGGIATDVSELRRAANRLEEQQLLLKNVISNIPYHVFWKDRSSVYLGCNDMFARAAGLSSADDIVGLTDFDMPWLPEQTRDYLAWDRRIIESGQPELNIEESIHQADGSLRDIMTSKVPLRDAAGKVYGLLGIIADLTEFKSAQRKILEQQAKLVVAGKMSALGEMAGSIAHEINNPLAIIHGKAWQLRRWSSAEDGFSREEIAAAAVKIEDTALRISKIVRALRSFARDAEADPFQLTAVQDIMADARDLCSERFRKLRVELKAEACPPGLKIECRPVQISQVLLNLLSNAFDAVANAKTREVTVACLDGGSHVDFVVTDSGPGVSSENRNRIFNPFFTTKSVGQGTGLGLSLSKGIAESHHGALFLDLASTRTRFVLRLPKRQSA